MGNLRNIGIALLLLALPGCAARLDARQDAAIRNVFDQARRHDFAAIETRLPAPTRNAVADARLQAQAALIPDRPPQGVKLVRVANLSVEGARETHALQEYYYPDRILLVATAVRERAGQSAQVLGFNVQAVNPTALVIGRFSLRAKSSMQYFLLGLAVLIPLLLAYAMFRLARERGRGWKWVWAPFILFGVTQLSINWATGEMLFQPLNIVLLGAAVGRGPLDVAPWFVTVSLPLGALIYLGRLWFSRRPEEME